MYVFYDDPPTERNSAETNYSCHRQADTMAAVSYTFYVRFGNITSILDDTIFLLGPKVEATAEMGFELTTLR